MTKDAHSGSRWEPGHLREEPAEQAVASGPADHSDPA